MGTALGLELGSRGLSACLQFVPMSYNLIGTTLCDDAAADAAADPRGFFCLLSSTGLDASHDRLALVICLMRA